MLYEYPRRYLWLSYLIVVAFMYGLGAGIARYLGSQFRVDILLLGWVWVLTLQLAAFFLHRYFDDRLAGEKIGEMVFGFLPWNLTMISGSALFLTVAASVFVVLIQLGSVNREIITLGSTGLVGIVFYTVPPVRLSKTGYGELSLAVLTCIFVPVFGFLLQYGSLHRILAMAIFPVGLLHIALLMVFDFPEYARKQKYGDQSLLLRAGWQRGITVHNLFVLGSFLLIGIAALAGFPSFAAWPSFSLLPLGLLQIYYLNRIGQGYKPNWNALILGSTVLFGLMMYFFFFAFWTH